MTQGDAERNYIRLIRLSFFQDNNEPATKIACFPVAAPLNPPLTFSPWASWGSQYLASRGPRHPSADHGQGR